MTVYVQKEENTILDSIVINFHVFLAIQTNIFPFSFAAPSPNKSYNTKSRENGMSHEIFFD